MALRIDDVDLQRDRMLVERFQEGDSTAFDTLYQRYFARLQRYCLKRVGDPHEAEEIAQEAFTRAYRALPDLAGERRFYPWMTVIAGRLCVDHHRRQGRTEPSADIDLGSVDGGQEAIVAQADFAMLSQALDRLAPRHREVLDMREHRAWTYQQIAAHYEVPVGTVEALLFRARKALKREFLAIAGSDRMNGLVGLPLLGAAARKWGLVKAKVAGWTSALPPAVAPALGVAAVIGSAAVVGNVVIPDSPRAPAVVTSLPAAAGTDSVVDGLDAAIANATTGMAPRAAATAPEPDRIHDDSTAPIVATPAAQVVDADHARSESEDDPVQVDTGNAFATFNPSKATSWSDDVSAEIRNFLQAPFEG